MLPTDLKWWATPCPHYISYGKGMEIDIVAESDCGVCILKPIQNGRGFEFKGPIIADERRMDIIITYQDKWSVIIFIFGYLIILLFTNLEPKNFITEQVFTFSFIN